MGLGRAVRSLLRAGAALLLFVSLATAAQTAAIPPGSHRFTLEHGGLERHYLVHVPVRHDPAVPAPLLVLLHGGGGSADIQANDRLYGQITQSESEGFIAVFPNGVSRLRSGLLATWNAGLCCGEARDSGADDVGFIRAVVTRLSQQLRIDSQRVYATGMSNGAMMAYRLACEAPDVFRAIAAVAGTDNTRDCPPGPGVAVLHIHALDDQHVLFGGGAGPASARRSLITDYRSVPDTMAKWALRNGCTGVPLRVLDLPGAQCTAQTACADGKPVQLCVTDTGGHSWPGGQKPRVGGDQPSQVISANALMWAFFKRR